MTAFTAQRSEHVNDGLSRKMDFPITTLACKTCWDGTTFTAPDRGLYFFAVSFVRDSQHPPSGALPGTTDDTYIVLKKGNKIVAQAFAGESTAGRQSASVAVTILLEAKDEVTCWDDAAHHARRRFYNCVFTGHRVGDAPAAGQTVP